MDRRDISQLLGEPKDEGKERASTSDSNDDREIWEISDCLQMRDPR